MNISFSRQTIRDVPLDNCIVLVRTDYNVPLEPNGDISDDLRIRASIPTLEYLLDHDCKIVIISHLGRPEGREMKYSLEPIAQRLAKLLKRDVRFVNNTYGDRVFQAVKRAPEKSIIVLENLRFFSEEEANDHEFASKIAKSTSARYFVQDGFGVVHRAHASTDAITKYIPSVAGLLLEREYKTITSAMESPNRPLTAILGGAKISDKIKIIERFVNIADKIIIGGAMANNFLAYKGFPIGASMCENDQKDTLDKIYESARKKVGENVDDFIILPVDVAVAKKVDLDSKRKNVSLDDVESDDIILDIGDKSIEKNAEIIKSSSTVVWNGNLGYSESPEFANGSASVASILASNHNITSIINGGNTAEFVLKWSNGNDKDFTHISTGGGVSLELLAGNKLPGVESLLDARS